MAQPLTPAWTGLAILLPLCITLVIAVSPLHKMGSDATVSDIHLLSYASVVQQSESTGEICPACEKLRVCLKRKADVNCDGKLDEAEMWTVLGAVANPIHYYVYPRSYTFMDMAANCTQTSLDEMPCDCLDCKTMDTIHRRFCSRKWFTCDEHGRTMNFYDQYYGHNEPRHPVFWGMWESPDKR